MTDLGLHDEAKLFHEGLRLFNTGEWFEAHEVWEDIWHEAAGVRKTFYQGLIQAAVVIEHIRRGNPRGMRNVYHSCMGKFEDMSGVYMGIDIDRLRDELTAFVQPVLDLPPERYDPKLPRGQELPVDLNEAPKIEFEGDPFGE